MKLFLHSFRFCATGEKGIMFHKLLLRLTTYEISLRNRVSNVVLRIWFQALYYFYHDPYLLNLRSQLEQRDDTKTI